MQRNAKYDRPIGWLIVVAILVIGCLGGVLIGLERGKQVYGQQLQEVYDSLPSEAVGCDGKPVTCRMVLDPTNNLICAMWLDLENQLVKFYCASMVSPQHLPQENLVPIRPDPKESLRT